MLRVRRNRQAGGAGSDASRRDSDARIEGHDAGGVGEQRVDVQLTDFCVIGGELADADQHFGDRVDGGGGLAAMGLQQAPDAGPFHLRARQQRVQGRQSDSAVLYYLDRDAALAEDDDRPEDRVLAQADEQLDRAGSPDHLLYEDAVDLGLLPTERPAMDGFDVAGM